MDQLLDTKSTPTLIAGLIVILALHFFRSILKDKSSSQDMAMRNLTKALESLSKETKDNTDSLRRLDEKMALVPQLQLSIKRLFFVVRHLSGEAWDDLYNKMKDIEGIDF